MKNYIFMCRFDEETYSYTVNDIILQHSIVGNSSDKIADMVGYLEKFFQKERITAKGNRKGTMFRNGERIGSFELITRYFN